MCSGMAGLGGIETVQRGLRGEQYQAESVNAHNAKMYPCKGSMYPIGSEPSVGRSLIGLRSHEAATGRKLWAQTASLVNLAKH